MWRGRKRWVKHVERMGEIRSAYVFVGKPEGKKPVRRKLEDNIRAFIKELEWDGVDWICLAQNTGQ